MDDNVRVRLKTLNGIINELFINDNLIEYLNFLLHTKHSSFNDNKGLLWIQRNIMAIQIINLYKIFKESEKHSFKKIINIAKKDKEVANFEDLEDAINKAVNVYETSDFEKVRSKYLAHQDLFDETLMTYSKTYRNLLNQIKTIFPLLCNSFGYLQYDNKETFIEDLSEILDKAESFIKIKSYIIGMQCGSDKTIETSKLQKYIE